MSGCAAVGCSNRGDRGFLMKSFPRDPERRALWASQMKRDSWQPTNNSRLCEVHFDNDQWEKTRQDGTRKLKCNAVPTLFQNSKQRPKGKGRKLKFIIPLKADVPLASKDESEAFETLDKSFENPGSLNVGTGEENGSLSLVDLKIETKTEVKSVDFVAKPASQSLFSQDSILEEKNKAQSESQRCLSDNVIRLSSLNLDTERLKCSVMNCGTQSEARESESAFHKFPLSDSNLLKKWLRICDKDLSPGKQSVICGKHFTLDCLEVGSRSILKSNAIPTLYKKSHDCEEEESPNLEEEAETYKNSSLQKSCELSSSWNRESEMKSFGDTRCRLCATGNGKNNIPIFGESDLAEKISRCLPIIVLPTDKLPLKICHQCLYNLNISYKLIIGSLNADSFLRSEFFINNNSQGYNEPAETPPKELSDNESAAKEEPVFRINGPIKCDLCDDFFQDMNVFDSHIETTHLLQWRCSLCDHSFETSKELLAHKTLNHSGQIATCKNCVNSDYIKEIDHGVPEVVERNRKADDKSDFERLIGNGCSKAKETEAKLTDLNCTKCKIAFEDEKQFRKHHTIHLPRRIKCSLCSKRFPSIFDYLTHAKVVHNEIKRNNLSKRNNLHGCKYCKKVFLVKQQLIVHLRKHKIEMLDDPSATIYKCVTCPKKFVDRALYQKHRNVHDPACWHKFRCYICNRSFMDKFKLKIHQSIHDGVKPYQCDVCGRTFNRNANMIRHRAKHFEQTCRHCENTFTNTQSLREHLKDVHADTLNPKSNSKTAKRDRNKTNGSGDNFVCGYCGKQLTSYYSLLDHERIHTGDKPYVCQHCGKAFRSITARWDHMVRHEKGNYICELCGKIMSNKLNLRRHLRKHAAIEQRRFECNECGKLFHVKWRLNAHLVRIHHSTATN